MFDHSKPQPKQTPHDLIAQAKEEVALNEKWDPAHDVARRLAHLRGEEYDPSTSTANDDGRLRFMLHLSIEDNYSIKRLLFLIVLFKLVNQNGFPCKLLHQII